MKHHSDRLLIKSQNNAIDLILTLQDIPHWRIKRGKNGAVLAYKNGDEIELKEKSASFILACCTLKCELGEGNECLLQRLHKDIQEHLPHKISSAIVPNLHCACEDKDVIKN